MAPAQSEKVSLVSLGCPKNLVDAEVMLGYLAKEGFTNVKEVEVIAENVRFGLPPEIVEAISPAPAAAE